MPRFEITDKLIHTLRPPQTGNRVVFGDAPGFGVCISQGGSVSFIYNYRIHGRQRRIKIGSYPAWTPAAARNKALKLQNAVENGIDPLAEKQRDSAAPIFGDLLTAYQADPETLRKRPGSLRNERGILANIIRPKLEQARVDAISRNDIAKLHRSLEATPYHANRTLALLSKIFNFAIRENWRADNPAKGIKKFHEERRTRWLTEEELKKFSTAIGSYSDQNAANALRLLLLTGSRENEVLRAEWPEFDLERGFWTKPSHHTKQQKTESIPLNDPALALLRQMAKRKKGTYLFPGHDGKTARVTLRKPWVQICKAAGLVTLLRKKGKRRHEVIRYRPTLRIHDLRHNFASNLVSRGVSLLIVGKLLGHTQATTTHRYAHLADSPLRQAANLFPSIQEKS